METEFENINEIFEFADYSNQCFATTEAKFAQDFNEITFYILKVQVNRLREHFHFTL